MTEHNTNDFDRLRHSLRRSMNGILAQQLRTVYPQYRLIYGLELTRISNICSEFQADKFLALTLWQSCVREEMIAATLLFPHDSVSLDDAQTLIDSALTDEIRSLLARNLLSHSLSVEQLCILMHSPSAWTCAVIAATSASSRHDSSIVTAFFNSFSKHAESLSLFQARAAAALLRTLYHNDRSLINRIEQFIAPFESAPDLARRFLFQEVTTELNYG